VKDTVILSGADIDMSFATWIDDMSSDIGQLKRENAF
jgi:hypothetical protein